MPHMELAVGVGWSVMEHERRAVGSRSVGQRILRGRIGTHGHRGPGKEQGVLGVQPLLVISDVVISLSSLIARRWARLFLPFMRDVLVIWNGAVGEDRTPGLILTKDALYH